CLIRRNAQGLVNNFQGSRWRWIAARASHGNFFCGLGCGRWLSFSLRKFFTRHIKKLIAARNFVDQPELQSFLRRIKFPLQNHFGGFFYADQPRQTRTTAPRWNESERRLWKSNPRRRIITAGSIITRQGHFVPAARGRAVYRGDCRNF